MKKSLFTSLAVASIALAVTSCSSKLGELSPEYFTVTPTPLVLQGNDVQATINGTFPEKYMKKKAVVTVTPELRGANGTVVRGQSATFQGEKVNGNGQEISYRVGGNYTMRDAFPYNDDLLNSDLYLTFDAKVGKKVVEVPAVKVGYGVIATANLYKKALQQGGGIIAPDSFKQVQKMKQEANIKFLINQAKLRKSELKNNSVQEFIDLLGRINKDAKSYNVNDIEVLAYASPDGSESFNDKLAAKRQAESEKYVNEQLKLAGVEGDVTGQYTAEDWEGFQQIVQASDIQDKDLILRVLSMYKDPQEREEQIKNLSKGFRDLADNVLPQLRRSRMIINYEAVGHSNEELAEIFKNNPNTLTADELLYLASITKDNATKEKVYKYCAQKYPNDYRGLNNAAAMEFANGNADAAKQLIQKATAANSKNGESLSNLALIALQEGNVSQAEALMAKAGNVNGINQVQGAVEFAKGNYTKAAQLYNGVNNNMAALAQIQAQDYAAARNTFKQITNGDAVTEYLHAILCAREGNKYATNSYLEEAIKKDASLKSYADKDLELLGAK